MRFSDIRIGVDFDEVIYPWHERAHNACELAGITGDCTRPLTWFPYEEYGISRQLWISTLTAAAEDGYMYSAPPMPGAVDALDLLREHGASIFIITARGNGRLPNPGLIRRLTYEYIEQWELAIDSVAFTADKEGVARTMKITHAIDDHLENYKAFVRAGAITYLHDQPWNMAPDFPVRRVNSLSEFAEEILVKV